MISFFPFYRQLENADCGPTCIQMIAKYYGKKISPELLREKCNLSRQGASLRGVSIGAEALGFKTLAVRLPFEKLVDSVPLPCIVHWQPDHFVVVFGSNKKKLFVADPSYGKISYSHADFLKHWGGGPANEGSVLLLEPTPAFYENKNASVKSVAKFLFPYMQEYRHFMFRLLIGLLFSSLLLLVFPFLTRALVDIGIHQQNLNYIYLILAAQLVIFISRSIADSLRVWVLLHAGTKANIRLISDFLLKLTRLPIRFFDKQMIGDVLQRINDHSRIEAFLTSSLLNAVFSVLIIFIFIIVLGIYSLKILFVFLTGSLLSTGWAYFFQKRRRTLDFKRFNELAANQSTLIQILAGMPEIKLNGVEQRKRWEWEDNQAKLFSIGLESASLEQFQQIGYLFINELKNILVTFITMVAVIHHEMTLGTMLAISYIIGQLNSPVAQLIAFMNSLQDTHFTLERIQEIHDKEEEETILNPVENIPSFKTISLQDVSFKYAGTSAPFVLHQLSLSIPTGKVTAIVGTSGSGKTTLIKMLLKFYSPTEGLITLDTLDLKKFSAKKWRQHCGTVMQDGYIFNNSILNNIAMTEEKIDEEKAIHAAKLANIHDYIITLPLGYSTVIGNDGTSLSQGQKQRILIARAIYRNPAILFFDEATSALDATNERIIHENLEVFFKNRTVVIAAHRLSTVKKADNVVVLEKGRIVEQGTHETLISRRGNYYHLVKDQLELGV